MTEREKDYLKLYTCKIPPMGSCAEAIRGMAEDSWERTKESDVKVNNLADELNSHILELENESERVDMLEANLDDAGVELIGHDMRILNIETEHVANTDNPHGVTKAQVGLGNADNTSDADKAISTATQSALDGKVNNTGNESISGKKTFTDNLTGEGDVLVGGDARISGGLYVDGEEYIVDTENIATESNVITLRDNVDVGLAVGDKAGLIVENYDGVSDGGILLDGSGTMHVGDVGDMVPLLGREAEASMEAGGLLEWDATGLVAKSSGLKASDLSNVDNTADMDKPISTAVATALAGTVKTTGDQAIYGVLKTKRFVEISKLTENSVADIYFTNHLNEREAMIRCHSNGKLAFFAKMGGILDNEIFVIDVNEQGERYGTIGRRANPSDSDIVTVGMLKARGIWQ